MRTVEVFSNLWCNEVKKDGETMFQNNLAVISAHFSDHVTRFSEDRTFLEIVNPFGGENIKIEYVPEDERTPYILYFSFQHWHMNDEEDIIEHIQDIIDGKLLSVEFFKCGKRCFGGDIEAQDLQNLSYKALNSNFSGLRMNIIDIVDSFKVRGWKTDANFDAVFEVDGRGEIAIKIL